jgi:quercetin dioxygenase-like cupin family protein
MNQALSEAIEVGPMTVRFVVKGSDSGGSLSAFECDVPANAIMSAPHSHDGFEETIYGLAGATMWTIDGREHEVGPGEALCVPRGSIHGFENRGMGDAKFLAIATPGVFGPAYFKEVGEVLASAAGGPPDRAAIAQVMHCHGLTPAPPNPKGPGR